MRIRYVLWAALAVIGTFLAVLADDETTRWCYAVTAVLAVAYIPVDAWEQRRRSARGDDR